MKLFARADARAKRATTAGRQARAGENVPRTARPAWWLAVGAPLERGVSEVIGLPDPQIASKKHFRSGCGKGECGAKDGQIGLGIFNRQSGCQKNTNKIRQLNGAS